MTSHKKKSGAHPAHHQEHHHEHAHPAPRTSEPLKNAAIVVLAIALVAVLIWTFTNNRMGGDSTDTKKDKQSDVPAASGDFDIDPQIASAMRTLADDDPFMGSEDAPVVIVEFSDYQCPYCARFWSDALPQIKENFIETGVVKFVYRDLALSFHANAQSAAEAAQCAHDQGKYWEYHDLLFANQAKLDENSLKKYAADLSLDVEEFAECLDSGKYTQEVIDDGKDANAQGITGTPGFVINGQKVSGAQPYDKFEEVICGIVPTSEPCKNVEPPVEFEVIVISDKNCASCDTNGIKAVTQQYFPGATFRDIDASSAEAKKLIVDNDLVYAPAYLFPAEVTQTKTWKTQPDFTNYFVTTADGGYRLRDTAVGAEWFFSEAKRQEHFAELNTKLGRVEGDNRPQVDFFVMSYCPYGNQAEELLKPVFDALKGKADFNPRYVIYTQGTGCYTDADGTQMCSLHGNVELNQNIRELCVLDEYDEQGWFDFAIAMNTECTSSNADTCWRGVAEDLGFDTDKIASCFDENKLAYAREQLELSQALGVSGSPTVFFEAQQYGGARTSNGYLAALCAGFEDAPDACDNVLEETTQAVQGNC